MRARAIMRVSIAKMNRNSRWKSADTTVKMKLIMDLFSNHSELHKPKSYRLRKKQKDLKKQISKRMRISRL